MLDPRELELPDVGWAALQDAESGEVLEVNTSDANVRAAFTRQAAARQLELKEFLHKAKIGHLEVRTDRPYHKRLRSFFEHRARTKIA